MSTEAPPEVAATTSPADQHLAQLLAQFPGCQPADDLRLGDGIPTAIVPPDQLPAVCRFLRDDPRLRYVFLAELCCIDYPERPNRFDVTYVLHSFEHNCRVRLKARAGGETLTIPSVTELWPAANWLEREVYDLFGVGFEGHPNLQRLLLPEDWEGHPLRRDEPTGGERVSFTEDEARLDVAGPVRHTARPD